VANLLAKREINTGSQGGNAASSGIPFATVVACRACLFEMAKARTSVAMPTRRSVVYHLLPKASDNAHEFIEGFGIWLRAARNEN
jgi:hypothetical protein